MFLVALFQITQMSFNGCTAKHTVVYSYRRRQLSNRKEQTSDTRNNLRVSKALCYVVRPDSKGYLLYNHSYATHKILWKRTTRQTESQLEIASGWEGRGMEGEADYRGHREFGRARTVPHLDCGGGYGLKKALHWRVIYCV